MEELKERIDTTLKEIMRLIKEEKNNEIEEKRKELDEMLVAYLDDLDKK